ncbi:sigma-54 dependent transcriptional regulator [Geobacter hydrogenophilus]|uniref:Acetoacetate metabolism regulatory protein AtoC n=1 Tax=Geobacter hydrogenophilus TaxID=40983 RepID=A0A9W6LD90_9BACT|nr:sigma-54 dependent transcriptional regulator [Geobacter hydrogenophilus]MBT0895279.1 sigma-54 dependent transcriptional regulator [Geobacter hydrogenophilus]GLI39508.1 acetoacetate metabolism regulatory protein AtoC [Geobacter hydrogenophilus]
MQQKILVIDDDNSLRRVLEYNLQEEGYAVQAASSGEEGLYWFGQSRPDLVITDMNMPGMDGLMVLKSIKERSPETLVIIITAFGTVDVAVEAMKAGAYDYITKPFNRDALKLTVKKALQFNGLAAENKRLKSELSDKADFRTIVGQSREMEKVFAVISKVADTEASILITGESGTGKELVARSIHANSSRREAPFVAINCAAIPRDLLESELFGHLKGAFTGAIKDKTGKFQLADGGTLFLDEVGELPLELQPKLLRALQEKEVEPVGGTKVQKVDVRIVAATNLDIDKAIAGGTFREDLYYRLSVIPVHLPPLRERRKDIPLLIRYFCGKHGSEKVTFAKDTLETLVMYPWPGNVRELENTIERLLIMRNGDEISRDELPEKFREAAPIGHAVIKLPDDGYPLEELEREVVVQALERNAWNQTAAARFLRIPRHTLIYRLEKYGITVPGHSAGK